MDTIDAHQHFWQLERGDYGWLTPALTLLYRDFLPRDLRPLAQEAGVSRSIVVQAAPTLAETRYLLDLTRDDPTIAGVVGWVPLDDPDASSLIDEFAREPKFKGVRPMLQDLSDDGWIARSDLDRAIEALIRLGLVFDALVLTRHLPHLIPFARRHRRLRIVVDHGAKPPIEGGAAGWQPWADGVAELAALPNVFCKMSGLVTEAAIPCTDAMLEPYLAHLVEHFSAARTMWGSDWPVVDMNGGYLAWHACATRFAERLKPNERAALFGGTARACYGL
ncbi:amidohydrolase family protein [Trinickia dinghuensis]|uniref:Amidohydrolase n=1 Tax=Trinickia dinghuensis TaxID=2291023 RepID=A0A3D8K3U4_9BURK|nr:amidohydrolase family protein [Trinickia dinghuensis]RDU99281.1 amidohydrolase [Trinickia dinghuensis]